MFELHNSDCIDILQTLEPERFQCCVTSPPYYGLRDYGLPAREWPPMEYRPMADLPMVEVPAMTCCLGLEPDPLAYIGHLVAVFREVHRVLRHDGVLWLNLGDTYAASGRGGNPSHPSSTLQGSLTSQESSMVARGRCDVIRGTVTAGLHESVVDSGQIGRARVPPPAGLKRKDLIGIPWRAFFALQADGWYGRQGIIWEKPNTMPESVRDRCTKAHEDIFLLAKSEHYFYDRKAIEEPQSDHERTRRLREQAQGLDTVYNLKRDTPHGQVAPGKGGVARSLRARHELAVKGTRNKRSVWTITNNPTKGTHRATYPVDLPETCILASSKPGDAVLDIFNDPVPLAWLRLCTTGTMLASSSTPAISSPHACASWQRSLCVPKK